MADKAAAAIHSSFVPRKSMLLLSVIFGLLAIFAIMEVVLRNGDLAADQFSGSIRENSSMSSRESETRRLPHTKRERASATDRLSLQEMEREFDEILPAQFPKQFSSLCDTTLKPGETLVLGGFRKADGNYEFTMLGVEPIGADGAPLKSEGTAPQYRITTRTLAMSRGKSSEMGLGALISPAMTRIQKSIVFPPGETPWLNAQDVATMPTVVTRPDQSANIQIGANDKAYKVSMIVSSEDSGNSIRIRTRVESPAGD